MESSEKKERTTPRCIGIIMDGNRRWARAHGKLVFDGHAAGYEKMKDMLGWAREADISYVILYAFSSENWNRPPEEVSYLMKLLKRACVEEVAHFKKENARIRVIGDRSRFSKDIVDAIENAEEQTKNCTGETLVIAVSYGGRDELVEAAKKLCGKAPSEITKETFAKELWTKGIPDPELIIRTSGEQRLSGFLLWQAAYSELFFTKTLWPDFTRDEFEKALAFFASTKRNFGV